MDYLTPDALDYLHAGFLQIGGTADLSIFTRLFLEVLRARAIDDDDDDAAAARRVLALADLFVTVDKDDDGKITFDDLIAATVGRIAPPRFDERQPPFRFVEVESASSRTTHSMRVREIAIATAIGVFFATEEDRSCVSVYRLSPRDSGSIASGYELVAAFDVISSGAASANTSILCAQYIEEFNVLVLGLTNSSLQFWDCRPLGLGRERKLGPSKVEASASLAPDEFDRVRMIFKNAVGGDLHVTRPSLGINGSAPWLASAAEQESFDESEQVSVRDELDTFHARPNTGNSKAPLYIRSVATRSAVRQFAWIPSVSKFVVSGFTPTLYPFKLDAHRFGYASWVMRVSSLGIIENLEGTITSLIPLNDLGLLFSTSDVGFVRTWAVEDADVGSGRGVWGTGSLRPRTGTVNIGGIFPLSVFDKVHERGILGATYVSSCRVVLSYGFDQFIVVWDVARADGGTPLYKLPAPSSSALGRTIAITSLEPPDTPFDSLSNGLIPQTSPESAIAALTVLRRSNFHLGHVASIDAGGTIRWWDVSRDPTLQPEQRCLQQFAPGVVASSGLPYAATGIVCIRQTEDGDIIAMRRAMEENANKLAFVPIAVREATGASRVLATSVVMSLGPKFSFFECTRCNDDRVTAAAAVYLVSERAVVSVCGTDLRFFSATTGKLERLLRGVIPTPAASGALLLDAPRQNLIVGLVDGCVLSLSMSNGVIRKALPRHYAGLSGLASVPDDLIIVTAGQDGRVHVYDDLVAESDGRRAGLLRCVKHAHGRDVAITALAVSPELSLIATAGALTTGAAPTIRVWGFCDLALVSVGEGHDAPITALEWLSPFMALASADAAGVVIIWAINRGKPSVALSVFGNWPARAPHDATVLATAESADEISHRFFSERIAVALSDGAMAAAAAVATPLSPGANEFSSLLTIPSGTAAAAFSDVVGVTSMAVIPAGVEFAKSLFAPGSAAPVPEGLPGTEAAAARARASAGGDPRYPTLVVGDENGRVSFWDMSAVLGDLRVEATTIEEAASADLTGALPLSPGFHSLAGGGSDLFAPSVLSKASLPSRTPRFFAQQGSVHAESVGGFDVGGGAMKELRQQPRIRRRFVVHVAPAVLADNSDASFDSAAATAPRGVLVRRGLEPIPFEKQERNLVSYNPRKRVKRTGGSLQKGGAAVSSRAAESSPRPVHPIASPLQSPEPLRSPLAPPPLGSVRSQLTAHAQMPLLSVRSLASPAGLPSGTGATAAPSIESARSRAAVSDAHSPHPRLLVPPLPALATTGLSGSQMLLEKTMETSLFDSQPLASPSVIVALNLGALSVVDPIVAGAASPPPPDSSARLPLIALAAGATLQPLALAFVHGQRFTRVTDDDTWSGFPVRSIVLAKAIDCVSLFTVGDDGTLRAVSLDGSVTGGLSVTRGIVPAPPKVERVQTADELEEERILRAVNGDTAARDGSAGTARYSADAKDTWEVAHDDVARAAAIAAADAEKARLLAVATEAAEAAVAASQELKRATEDARRAAAAAEAAHEAGDAAAAALDDPAVSEGGGVDFESCGGAGDYVEYVSVPGAPGAFPAWSSEGAPPAAVVPAVVPPLVLRDIVVQQLISSKPVVAFSADEGDASSTVNGSAIPLASEASIRGALDDVGRDLRTPTLAGAAAENATPSSHAAKRRQAALLATVQTAKTASRTADDFNLTEPKAGAQEVDDAREDSVNADVAVASTAARANSDLREAARDRALQKIRAVAVSASTRPEAARVNVGGVKVIHTGRAAVIAAQLQKSKNDYPSLYRELSTSILAELSDDQKSAFGLGPPRAQPSVLASPRAGASPAADSHASGRTRGAPAGGSGKISLSGASPTASRALPRSTAQPSQPPRAAARPGAAGAAVPLHIDSFVAAAEGLAGDLAAPSDTSIEALRARLAAAGINENFEAAFSSGSPLRPQNTLKIGSASPFSRRKARAEIFIPKYTPEEFEAIAARPVIGGLTHTDYAEFNRFLRLCDKNGNGSAFCVRVVELRVTAVVLIPVPPRPPPPLRR